MSLPSGYVELEYIESTGTQYVDSGFIPNQDTRVVMDTTVLNVNDANTGGFFFGSGYPVQQNGIEAYIYSGGLFIGVYNAVQTNGTVQISTNQRLSIDFNKNVCSAYAEGSSVYSKTFTYTAFTSPVNLVLFSLARSSAYRGVLKMYSCQIYDNGLLVRDYIPAMTVEGEIGLYDRVFKEFFRNAGTGEFIAGPEMVHEDYTELEYIESAAAQYVDTGFKPNQDTRVVMDAQMVAENTGDNASAYFGARTSATEKAYAIQWNPSFDCFQYFFNNGYDHLTTGFASFSDRQIVEINKGVLSIGESTYTRTYAAFQCAYSLFLGALNSAGSVRFKALMKFYFCQIYDNDVLIRNYIPRLHPSGVAGLWDSANERFYASATTTDFIAGPETSRAPSAPTGFYAVSESDTELTLTWNPVEDAAGYRLYRSGALLADTTETTFTDTVAPFGGYTYYLAAYNDIGEGAGTSLTYFNVPENPVLYLVTDRTQEDVKDRNSKGVYQNVDLNRVGAAVEYLQKRLLFAGILADVSPRTDWLDSEWMSAGEARVYLDNVKTMRAALAMPTSVPAAPADMANLTYAEANHIEEILVILDTLLTDMVLAYRHCGTTVCGMGGLIL